MVWIVDLIVLPYNFKDTTKLVMYALGTIKAISILVCLKSYYYYLRSLIAGMSDLLSPFIVLYEDNADAFWCFEMLLRRMVNFMFILDLSPLLLLKIIYIL